MNGLKEDRKAVLGGGLSVLLAIFDLLKIDKMQVAKGALRHGVLYDMIAKDNHNVSDIREASVKLLASRFSVNTLHANNVKDTATHLFDQISDDLNQTDVEIETHRKILGWAAQLHEIGSAISHTESHRHGAYILDHTELMGFSQNELHRLSLLVLGHYGKIRKLEGDFNDIGLIVQLVCLRLAVIFCHSRHKPALRDLSLHLHDNIIQLNTTQAWIQKFPQTAYLLEEEVISWKKTTWNLIVIIASN